MWASATHACQRIRLDGCRCRLSDAPQSTGDSARRPQSSAQRIRCRSCLDHPARRAPPAAPAHARNACGAHHARHPLAADRHTSCSQLGVDPRRAVPAAATGVNLSRAGRQVRIGLRASRRWAPTQRVVPARGDTEHTGHRGDARLRLVRAHEPETSRVRSPARTRPWLLPKSHVLRPAAGSPGAVDATLPGLRCADRPCALRRRAQPARPSCVSTRPTARTPEPVLSVSVRNEPARPSAVRTPPDTAVSIFGIADTSSSQRE